MRSAARTYDRYPIWILLWVIRVEKRKISESVQAPELKRGEGYQNSSRVRVGGNYSDHNVQIFHVCVFHTEGRSDIELARHLLKSLR